MPQSREWPRERLTGTPRRWEGWTPDRLDLVVADRRGSIESLAAYILVGLVSALRFVVVDEVSGVDRLTVLPDRLRVDDVDDRLGTRCRLRSAVHQLRVENRLQLCVCDERLRPDHVEDLLKNEKTCCRRVDVEASKVLVKSEGQVSTALHSDSCDRGALAACGGRGASTAVIAAAGSKCKCASAY